MKSVIVLADEKKKRKIFQVDIKEVVKNPDEFEDLIDVLVTESKKKNRRNPEKK